MTQTIINLGTGGAVLNGRNGSTTGADSNDARFLDWDGENYVYLPGVAGNALSVPDAAALDITGDITLMCRVACSDLTPASAGTFIGKYVGVGTGRSYFFRINAAGTLTLVWSADGTAGLTRTSSAAVTGTDGAAYWFAVTLDVDDGAGNHIVRFWQADDASTVPSSWTQVGADVTTAGVTSIFSGAATFYVGTRDSATEPLEGKVYRAIVASGIGASGVPGGTTVLDVDTSVLTSGAATTFTALTGQTVTIGRSTAGRKAVAVVSPVWLFGTDDYMEVADNDLLDFGASDDFTVLAVIRQWATPISNGTLVQKASATNTGGYVLRQDGTTFQVVSATHDGTNSASEFSAAASAGLLASWSFTVNRATQLMTMFLNGTAAPTPASTSSVGSLVNSEVLRIGRRASSGTNYQDFELLAVAVFRRALTAAEISAITAYYQARLS